MLIVRVKDRGRDLARHAVDEASQASELARVYVLLGYRTDRIIIEPRVEESQAA